MDKLSLIIPAYNEEKRLTRTLPEIVAFAKKRNAEVIVVDDGSTDGTADLVRKTKGVRLVQNDRNRGKGYSVRHGMLEAKGDWRLFMDADLSTPLKEVDKILKAGTPVAIGSRAAEGANITVHQPWMREQMGKVFRFFVQILLVPKIKDTQCGFKLFRADAAEDIFRRQLIQGFSFDVEALFLARKLKYPIAEVPVEWADDPSSRVHPYRDAYRMFHDLLIIRWNWLMGRYYSGF